MPIPSLEEVLAAPDPEEKKAPSLDDVLAAPDPEVPGVVKAGAAITSAIDTLTLGGGGEIVGALNVLSELGGEKGPLENYREARDRFDRIAALSQKAAPGYATGGQLGAIGTTIAASAGPAIFRGLAGAGRGALALAKDPAAAVTAARAAPGAVLSRLAGFFSPEAGKAAVKGAAGAAAVGGAAAGLSSEADLTKGEIAPFGSDVLSGATNIPNLLLGGLVGGAVGSKQASLRRRAASAEKRVGASRRLDADEADRVRFEKEVEELPLKKEAAQKAALAESQRPTRKKALQLAGLESRSLQNRLGGPTAARKKALAIYDEPAPGSNKTLIEEGLARGPQERFQYAQSVRKGAGRELGEILEELNEQPQAFRQKKVLLQKVKSQFTDLPPRIQKDALAEVEKVLDDYADKAGRLSPKGVRNSIDELTELSGFETSDLEKKLGERASKVYQKARAALTEAETGLVKQHLPKRFAQYSEAKRRYGVYRDFEKGSRELALREGADAADPIRYPKPVKPEIPEPTRGQYPGGDLQRERDQNVFLVESAFPEMLRTGGAAVGFAAGRGSGSLAIQTALRKLGARGADAISAFLQIAKPSTAELETISLDTARKLEKFTPVFQKALQKGADASYIAHLMLYESEPEYRQAIDELSNGGK